MKNKVMSDLRYHLSIVTVLFGIVVLFGSGINDRGHKYSSVSRSAHRPCRRELFIKNIENSNICCDSHMHQHDWVCLATEDKITKTLASSLAFIIPLLPWLMNALFDVYSMLIMRPAVAVSQVIRSSLYRLLLYVSLILFRTYVLYYVIYTSYKRYAGSHHQQCWYADLTSSHTCKDFFDYSDHIVLFYAQFAVVLVIEYSYTAYMYSTAQAKRADAAAIVLNSWRLGIVAMICVVMMFLCLRSAFFTTIFFHTPAESIIGLIVAMMTSGTIVYLLPASSFWATILSIS